MKVTVNAPAKLNLTLDVLGRRADGYHEIQTVMQAIDLMDQVTLEETSSGITVSVAGASLPTDERNTAYKAAREFLSHIGRTQYGVHITLQKNIPMMAGMAGGSADAAAVLVGLNQLIGAELSSDTLCMLAARVGADVPFCLMGGTALATGTGIHLSSWPSLPDCSIVAAKPETGVSTATAYAAIDSAQELQPADTVGMHRAIVQGDLVAVGKLLHNGFEQALAMPEVTGLLDAMRIHSPLGCRMTGSGSAVFALFDDPAAAKRCAEELCRLCNWVQICRPYAGGATVCGK